MPSRLSHNQPTNGLEIRGESTAIRRILLMPDRWWVRVEAWRQGENYWRGRLVFIPDGMPAPLGARWGPPALFGRSREDVVGAAYEVPEERLREVLHSLA